MTSVIDLWVTSLKAALELAGHDPEDLAGLSVSDIFKIAANTDVTQTVSGENDSELLASLLDGLTSLGLIEVDDE